MFQHRRAFLRSCVPPVLPVLRLFGAGVAAVDVLAALHFALCGMVAQPGKEQRQQQQYHRGDEVGVGDDAEGFDAARATGLSEYYLRKELAKGTIPHLKSGRCIMINVPALLLQLGVPQK